RDEAALGSLGRRIAGLSRRGALADACYGWKPANVHLDALPVPIPVPRRDTKVSHKLNVARDGPFSGSMVVRQGLIGRFPINLMIPDSLPIKPPRPVRYPLPRLP